MTHATPPLGNNCGEGNPKRHNCQKKKKKKKKKKRGAHHIPMAVSNLNDLEIGGQLMDDNNSLRRPPRPEEGPTDKGITPLRHYPNPLDEGKTASS